MAAEAELPVASKADSMDLCFLAGTGKAAFLARHAGLEDKPGEIVDAIRAKLPKVPIVLATIPLAAEVAGAERLFNIVLAVLLIGVLAFENAAAGEVIVTDRLGILAGTMVSAIVGSLVLHWALPRRQPSDEQVSD